jgi:hypothetical protein
VTPNSPLAGLLTGLVDGLLIATVVVLALYLTSRRQRTAHVVHPVAEDVPSRSTRPGELPKPFAPRS